MLLCYFALASGHSLWGLILKRGAISGEPAGLLQQLQLLLFEIELPVRTSAIPWILHHDNAQNVIVAFCPLRPHGLSNATDLGAGRGYGVGLHAPSPARWQPFSDLV